MRITLQTKEMNCMKCGKKTLHFKWHSEALWICRVCFENGSLDTIQRQATDSLTLKESK